MAKIHDDSALGLWSWKTWPWRRQDLSHGSVIEASRSRLVTSIAGQWDSVDTQLLVLSTPGELSSYIDQLNVSDVLHPVGRDCIRCPETHIRPYAFDDEW